MPLRRFDFPGQRGGLVADSNEFTLAPTEWSDCNNVRFHNRTISRISGETSLYGTTQLTTAPRHSQFLDGNAGNDFYYYIDSAGHTQRINAAGARSDVTRVVSLRTSQAVTISRQTPGTITFSAAPNFPISGGDILVVTGVTGDGASEFNRTYVIQSVNGLVYTTDVNTASFNPNNLSFANISITRQEFFPGTQRQMNVASGGNVLLVNDGTTTPEYINSASAGSDNMILTQIPGWNYVAGETSTAAVIRPFKYVWVAGDLTTTTTSTGAIVQKPGTIRVSNRAAPGALPTWDPNATGADTADEFELAEGGAIVDMVSLGDTLCVFTDDEIYGLRVGNTAVTSTKLLQGRGMLSQGCGVEFFGKLFVVGNEDIYLFQGGAATQSIADERVRDYFFDNIHGTHHETTFVIHNEREDEIWVCFPNASSTGACNEAIIWNYSHNSWSKRDLPHVYPGSFGPTRTGNAFNFADIRLQLPGGTNRYIMTMDEGDTMFTDGGTSAATHTAFVERRSLDLSPDSPNISKWIHSIDFKLIGTGTVDVTLQPTNSPNDTVTLTGSLPRTATSRTFNMGNGGDLMISPNTNGKFINLRIEGTDDWELVDYVVDFKATDRRTRGGA